MHYAISTKVLGQTHMWNTQNKRSNFLKIFQFFMVFFLIFFFFWTHLKTEHKMKINKNKSKAKARERNTNKLSMWDQSDRYATKSKKVHTRARVQGMIPTPIVLHKVSNFGPSRGLVNMFAFWLSVVMNSKYTVFSSTKSQMKWYRISMCFDFECWTGFFDKFMALVLSQNTHIVSWVIP